MAPLLLQHRIPAAWRHHRAPADHASNGPGSGRRADRHAHLGTRRHWAVRVMSSKSGEFNEGLLRGLDFALNEARKKGLKVRFVLPPWRGRS